MGTRARGQPVEGELEVFEREGLIVGDEGGQSVFIDFDVLEVAQELRRGASRVERPKLPIPNESSLINVGGGGGSFALVNR